MSRRVTAEPSQLSMRQFVMPSSSSGWRPINGTSNGTRPRPTQLRRTGTGSGDASGIINSRPSGIERPPFSIGPGESRGVVCAVCYSNSVERAVGLAFVNIPIAEAVLTSITDTQFYPRTIHKIQMMEASRILMQPTPATAVQSGLALQPHIKEEMHSVPIIEMPRPDWSEADGMAYIRQIAFAADLPCIEFAVKDNHYALCAFSAAMKYIKEDFGFTFDDHSVRIKYQPPADVMMISLPTIRSLELIQNANNSSSRDCLFGLLNRTKTPMGARILRSNILQPSTQASVLNPRFDAVGELARSDTLLTAVQDVLHKLKPLGDIEQLLTKLVIMPKDGSVYESEQAINNILKLKAFLAAVPDVFEALEGARTPLLADIRKYCRPGLANDIMETIAAVIDESASYASKPLELRNQRVHTVRNEISASLDIQRKLYEDFSGQIHEYINELEDEIRVKITLKFTAARKFYLQVKAADFGPHGPPAVLINRNKVKGNIECQTLKLVGYNERINQAVNGAMMESDEVVKGLLSEMRSRVCTLFKYCEGIALVDMLSSFAGLAQTFNYTRPVIHNDVHGLVAARHPILDSRGWGKCIPNDYFVTEESRFQIITGQNMSGKSTYIRSIAMLQIMAQIGCYVPAESARFPLLYSLFARVSTDDVLEANLSTFSVEMREMAFILRNVNDKSLVIVDELGRATSTRDGLAIAAAMSEALLQSHATVFFATHFIELARGMANCIGVVNRHLQTETSRSFVPASSSALAPRDGVPVMKMLYRVTDGAETETSYGISLAKAIGFPPSFIARAEAVAAEIQARAQANKGDKLQLEEAKRRKLVANLDRQLQLAHQSSAGDDELWQYLKQIHDEFWAKMIDASDAEEADAVDADGAHVPDQTSSDKGKRKAHDMEDDVDGDLASRFAVKHPRTAPPEDDLVEDSEVDFDAVDVAAVEDSVMVDASEEDGEEGSDDDDDIEDVYDEVIY